LPPEIFLWGHLFLSFSISKDKRSVKIRARVLATEETAEVDGDLLVAADGCNSLIRNHFFPDIKLRSLLLCPNCYASIPNLDLFVIFHDYVDRIGIQATAPGEEFLIFQDERIQKPFLGSRELIMILGNVCTMN